MDEFTHTPANWALTTVSKVADLRLGRQKSADYSSGGVPTKYLRAANIGLKGLVLDDVFEMPFSLAEQEVYRLCRGDVVLAEASGTSTMVGRASVWNDEIPLCCFQNTVIRARCFAVLPGFAALVFNHYAISGAFAKVARGIGILHLGAARLAELPFPVPPIEEQARIESTVGLRLDELVNAEGYLNSAIANISIQTNTILAAAALGQLLAVDDSQNLGTQDKLRPASGIDSRVSVSSSLAGDEANESDVRELLGFETVELPNGWKWSSVGKVGEVSLGKMREPKSHLGSHMRPYLRVANVQEDRLDLKDVKEMNFDPEEVKHYELKTGDILLNEGQSPDLVGRPAMYRDEIPGACFQKTLLRFRAGPKVIPEFALIVFRHYLRAGAFRKNAQWSTNIAHLSQKRFVKMPFPLPPLDEQRRIVAEASRRLSASSSQMLAVVSSLQSIPSLRAELLAAAVSGTLTSQNLEGESGEALLERLSGGKVDSHSESGAKRTKKRLRTENRNSEHTGSTQTKLSKSFAQIAKDMGRSLTILELFHAAGLDSSRVEDVEKFYLRLRGEIGVGIRECGSQFENTTIEAY